MHFRFIATALTLPNYKHIYASHLHALKFTLPSVIHLHYQLIPANRLKTHFHLHCSLTHLPSHVDHYLQPYIFRNLTLKKNCLQYIPKLLYLHFNFNVMPFLVVFLRFFCFGLPFFYFIFLFRSFITLDRYCLLNFFISFSIGFRGLP